MEAHAPVSYTKPEGRQQSPSPEAFKRIIPVLNFINCSHLRLREAVDSGRIDLACGEVVFTFA